MDAHKPTVSIGMPVYNGAAYLEEALDCILAQTFGDFELIVSDNASTDATEEICRRYAGRDPRVRYHRQPQNLGAAANYDAVYAMSRGRYFRWHAHDDLIAPEYLARTVAVLDDDPECVLADGQALAIGPGGEELVGLVDSLFTPSDDPAVRFANWVLPPLSGTWAPWRANAHFFGLIRRELMERTPLHGDFPGSDDVVLGSILMLGRCRVVPEALLFKRIQPEAYTLAVTDVRDRVAWLSGKRPSWPVMRNWRVFLGHHDALRRSGLTGRERRDVRRVILRAMWTARRRLIVELVWPIYFNGQLTRLGRWVVPDRMQERPTAEHELADVLRVAPEHRPDG